MSRTVTVVDYGVGNLLSIARAVERVGAVARISGDADEVADAELLVLPGVGAFGHCADNLRAAALAEPVRTFAASGRPFLGICVGMQLLFDYGTEFGRHAGLGLIPGSVEAIPAESNGTRRKVPHIGWSALQLPPGRSDWARTAFAGLTPSCSSAYFVHSFTGRPAHPAHLLATVDHQSFEVCAAVRRENVTGVQFHPEKSGPVGLAVLEAFLTRRD